MSNRVLFRLVVWMMMLACLASGYARSAPVDHTLWTARWSPDGSHFAIGGAHALWVFDATTLKRQFLLPEAQASDSNDVNTAYMAVTSVDWHPNGNLLAVASQGPGLDAKGIYDIVSSGRVALEGGFSRGVSWSPRGEVLAMTSDGHLRLWRQEGVLLHDMPRYEEGKGLSGVAWSPAGDRIVTIGARITLHDGQGTPIRQMMHRPETKERIQLLLSVAWHPSGVFFAVGDYGTEVDDPVLQFWSADGELLKNISLAGDAEIRSLSWNRDGSRLASASQKLCLWTREGTRACEAEAPEPLWGVDWHPKGDRLVTCSLAGRVTLWTSSAKVMEDIILPPAGSGR